ncbi:MAG: lipoyl synthase [candidate division KSB1 bacterium]|nr:lipoyl synthase [candidate division KSB1 bacterium]MDZ7275583.1 lipoyl synthase [candidate division KSB1 bacterium]MDZ7284726.1 lipoyl synthase [candidate division KSB1 bacterium]MDZ7297855.1 lipoyl synthase [candidate division KSB1 bacterium]MDZ7348720.1 lipoyl synthase [candidate division KSB1 bacterium]
MSTVLPLLDSGMRPPLRVTPRPAWLKVKIPGGEGYHEIKQLVDRHRLHTVCEEARCPNIAECWSRRSATFMILGDICTRSCGFCAVKTGRPAGLDWDEPRRVAEAVACLNLRHAVITSVNRDELPDGGAALFAATIRAVRARVPGCSIEVLIPDFKGNQAALHTVLEAGPEILNHNVETIARLYRRVRPQANYRQSLELLQRAKKAGAVTKSGFMLGLGETLAEAKALLVDLHATGLDIATIGQYLQPTPAHVPVARFVPPAEFQELKEYGLALGLRHVESGPLVRSSYHADEQAQPVRAR